MTNEQIIFNESARLMEAGKIGTTGRMFTFEDGAGNTVSVPEPEPIHTYQAWKSIGYQVRKGEHAVAKFAIWKHTTRTNKDTGEQESKMFLKMSAFFSAAQVDRVKAMA